MTCETGKQPYATAQEAIRVKTKLLDRSGRHSEAARKSWCRGRLIHYRCEWCGQWHVGHAAVRKGAA